MQSVISASDVVSTLPRKVALPHCSTIFRSYTSGSGSTADSDNDKDGVSPVLSGSSDDFAPADHTPGLLASRLLVPAYVEHAKRVKPMTRTPLRSQASAYTPRAGPALPPPRVDNRTTVMLSQVPYSYTTDMLIDLLNSKGFATLFDFLYVPINFITGLCVGYAFVNLTTSENAKRFFSTLDGFSGWESFSKKVCKVNWSNVQGLVENIARYRNSPVMSDSVPNWYKPILFEDGVRAPFPKPTKKLGILRLRKAKADNSVSELLAVTV